MYKTNIVGLTGGSLRGNVNIKHMQNTDLPLKQLQYVVVSSSDLFHSQNDFQVKTTHPIFTGLPDSADKEYRLLRNDS